MNGAKIQLSAEELNLLQNAGWLLTKNNITEKVTALLAQVSADMQSLIQHLPRPLPAPLTKNSPKISKGEKYEGLPWQMLDYPRLFSKEDTCAIRTFFWWGHAFSVTLHLKGRYKLQYQQLLLQNIGLLKEQQFYICVGNDEWQHYFREDYYMPLHQLENRTIENILSGSNFCKFSAKIPLHQWDQVHSFVLEAYRLLLQSIGH